MIVWGMLGELLTLVGGTAVGLGAAYAIFAPKAPVVAPGGALIATAAQDYWRLTEAEYNGIKNLMRQAGARYQALVRANGNRPATVWMQTQGTADTLAKPAAYVASQGGNRAMYLALAPLYVSTNYGDFIDVAGYGRMFRTPGLEKSVERYVVETVLRNYAAAPRQLTQAYVAPALPRPVYVAPALPGPVYVAPARRY